jgi:hypothetical protein
MGWVAGVDVEGTDFHAVDGIGKIRRHQRL